VFISELGKKKSAVGFIPDPDKMESLRVSKENFLKNFKSVVNNSSTLDNVVEEKESKIEENEQFIIDLLSKTQPHHDHSYTTVFGKRKNTEQVEELINSLEDEKKVVHNWKQHLIKHGLAKRVIFIDPPDSYKRNKKKPVPILFLRHR
jgi:HEAT repeat protein